MIKQINLSNFIEPFGYIYCHRNMINGKRYIGANVSRRSPRYLFIYRKKRTLNAFLNAYNHNPHFYNALKKDGIKSFETVVLDFTTDLKDTDKKEDFYIKKYKTLDRRYGYNLKSGGRNGLHSEETKRKIGEKHKGKKISEEIIRKIIQARKGYKHTKETKRKMSERQKGERNSFHGKHHTNEVKIKISENNAKIWKGKKFSKEHRKKISESKKGSIPWNKDKKGVYSKESRRKMSESQRGNKNHNFGKIYSKKDKEIQKNSHKGEKYCCSECKINHYYNSKKGKEHFKNKKEVK